MDTPTLADDAIRANAARQALNTYVRQQLAVAYQECPFFATSGQGITGTSQVDMLSFTVSEMLSFTVSEALNARLFSIARTSPLQRLALLSACIKYLAFLHCREVEGCLAFAIGAGALRGDAPAADPSEALLLPVSWRFENEALAQPVKRLFGQELAQWKRLAALVSATAPGSSNGLLLQPPKVLVGYSEVELPFGALDTTPYALGLWIRAGRAATTVHLRFDAARVDAQLMPLLFERLTLLLSGMLFEPDASLASRPWVSAAERERVALLSSLVAPRPLQYRNLAQAIAASIRERPHAIFLESGASTVSFSQLAGYTEALLSRWLHSDRGFTTREQLGECVLIVGTKSVTTTLAAMACMRIGVAFCLQPHDMPQPQLAEIATTQRTRTVLLEASCRELEQLFQGLGCQVVPLSDYDPEVQAASSRDCPEVHALLRAGEAVDPQAALCVIMTSGSEGRPKGCVNTHRALLNIGQEQRALYRSARSRVASMASHTFDYFVVECVLALSQDIVLVLAPPEARVDARRCIQFLRDSRIDVLFVTTVLAEDIMERGDIPTLRQLYFGGESLRAFRKNDYELFNLYGPCETGALATYLPILRNGQKATIGRPFGGCQCVVVFPGTFEPCPIGVPGELLIGGIGVGLGYLNRPDLAQRSFVEVRTAELEGRFYRSGDVCCWNADGELEIFGRRDRQLKVNGFRVELDAIERMVIELPAVSAAAIVGVEDRRGHARLVAFVVPADERVTEHDIKDVLSRRVPVHMVPSQIVLVPRLPLTRNGKLDRKALVNAMGEGARAEVVRPRGPLQEWLVACWSEDLELDPALLSVGRSFFDLGGHSLRAARMLARVQQELGHAVSLLEFFKNDTIEALAAMLETRAAAGAVPAIDDFSNGLAALPATPAEGCGPLSPQEARLYAEYCLDPDSRAYLLTVEVPLAHDIAVHDVRQALQALTARHDVLRTRYRLDGSGVAYAQIQPSLSLERVLIENPAEWSSQRASRFDLAEGPLWRCHLGEAGTPRARLELQVHHIIIDKPSLEILELSLQKLLRRELPGAVELSYRSYAIALLAARRRPSWARAEAFWKQHLEGVDFDPLGHGPVLLHGNVRTLSWSLSRADLVQLQRVLALLGVTPATFFLGVWGLALAREGNCAAFSISVAKAYRPPRAQQTVGMFVSLSPCAFRFGRRGVSMHDFMMQLAEEQWQAADHHFYPVEEVFPLLSSDPRIFGRNPLLNVAFTYVDTEHGERLTSMPEHAPVEAHGPLNLTVVNTDGASRLLLEYQAGVFSEARITTIANTCQQLLQRILRTPPQLLQVDELLASLRRETSSSRRVRQPGTRMPIDVLPIDVLLRDALLTGADRPAVADAAGTMTWTQFGALTAAYARALDTPNVRRALIIGKQGRQLQAFLAACFMTRTTYLALEAGTPPQRVREVVEHAAPDLVLTTEDSIAAPASVDWSAFQSVKSVADNPVAWILYSSGTTGRPKGICVSADAAAQYLESITKVLRLERGLRIVQQFSPSFDGYLEEVLLAWALQGTSIVTDRYSLLDEHKARAFLEQHRPAVISASPALFSAWNRWPGLGPLPRVCISGGDFLAAGDIHRLLDRTEIWNSYGPTETCIAVSMVNCARLARGTAPCIGEPFDHVELSVVDAEGRRLDAGCWGELVIHGDFEHHAYLDAPALTAQKFGRDAQGVFFRTGDLAMAGQDGLFHLKGRMDDSCKVRGNFIALGDLESRAGQYPGVHAAGAAVAFAGTPEACLVLVFEGNAAVQSGLQQHLARHYPRSHLPSVMFPVEGLPRTQAGKLDRERIVTLFQQWQAEAARTLQEQHALEAELQTLIACWRDCLGFSGPLTLESDFFAISGSSLSAVRLASQLQARFGVELSPVDIFRDATVGEQWALIKARRGHEAANSPVRERLLTIDAPGTPHLVLLPPALGGLVELTALSANLNGRVTVSVLTLDSSQAQALTESELATLLLQALWTCARRYEAGSRRALWLGGYSMGAEILAALVARQPELLKSCERLVLLDPNPCTEVFGGDGLYTEFVSFFSSLAERLQSTAPLRTDIGVDLLRRELPAVYSEWRYYELQHQLLAGTTLEERITTAPLLDFPLTLFFSDDVPAASVEALQHRLVRNARIHRRRGDHVAFIGALRAEDFIEADAGRAALYPQPAATRHSTAASIDRATS